MDTSANYYFIRDLYAEHRKNFYNSHIKRANDLNKLFTKVKLLSHVPLFATPWTAAYRQEPWDFPGKNTGVGCHFLQRTYTMANEHMKYKELPLTPTRTATGKSSYSNKGRPGYSKARERS